MRGIALLGLAALLIQDDPPADAVKKALPTAESIEKKEFTVSKEQGDRIQRSTGIDAAEVRVVYHDAVAQLMYPESGKYKTRTIAVRAEGEKGPIRLLVSILPEERMVVSVKVLEHHEEGELDKSEFFSQFLGLKYSGDALWRPPSDLKERQDRAAQPASDEDRGLQVLVAVRAAMTRAGDLFPRSGSKIRAKDKDAAQDLQALKDAFSELARTLPGAGFLGEIKQKKFSDLLDDGRERLDKLLELVRAEKFAEAQDRFGEATRKSCGACHAVFQSVMRSKREEVGLGTGYLSIGFDLKESPDRPRKVQDSIAAAVRRGILLLELAPQ